LRRLAQLSARQPRVEVLGYTVEGASAPDTAVLSASDIRISQHGASFQLSSPFGNGNVRTHLIGRFNVSNVLAVAGVLFARGLAWNSVIRHLESLVAVPGRTPGM